MVDKINTVADSEATSQTETAEQLNAAKTKTLAPENSIDLYKECLSPECDC